MTIFDLGPVEHLGAALDTLCADMDDEDKALLHAIFAQAGLAVGAAHDDEVSGFSLNFSPVGSFFQSFQAGASQSTVLPGLPKGPVWDALNPQPLPP